MIVYVSDDIEGIKVDMLESYNYLPRLTFEIGIAIERKTLIHFFKESGPVGLLVGEPFLFVKIGFSGSNPEVLLWPIW